MTRLTRLEWKCVQTAVGSIWVNKPEYRYATPHGHTCDGSKRHLSLYLSGRSHLRGGRYKTHPPRLPQHHLLRITRRSPTSSGKVTAAPVKPPCPTTAKDYPLCPCPPRRSTPTPGGFRASMAARAPKTSGCPTPPPTWALA